MSEQDGGGDEAWFTALYVRHAGAIRAYAARRAPDEADDLVAEVFSTAWRLRHRVPPDDDGARLWLYASARHTVLHVHRSAMRRARLAARARHDVTTAAAPDRLDESVTDRVSAQARVRQAMTRLNGRDAEILRLWAWEGLGPADLASVLGCTQVAARVRLHRAQRRIAALLELTSVADLMPDRTADPPSTRQPGTGRGQAPGRGGEAGPTGAATGPAPRLTT